MRKMRLLFSKTGRAIYLSHLDLMRTFQRAFLRADLKLRHTEGFNPHPYMSFALPLSVGCESVCELLDFDLLDDTATDKLIEILNRTMPDGITVVTAYEAGRRFPEIKFLSVEGRLIYDNRVPEAAVSSLSSLFKSKELIISKKSKKGPVDVDIIPSIHSIEFRQTGDDEILIDAVISAQEPSLNPELLITAIKAHLNASFAPDFAKFKRLQVFDRNHSVFR